MLHLARKTQPKVVQELLGHSNISMTLDRYSQVTETMQRDAAAASDELINAAKSAAS